MHNSNDIVRGLDRVMNDQNGYYLIGFTPDEKTFKTVNGARPFHDVKVTVKRAGLHVRYHHGFYGISDEEVHSVPLTRAEQMAAASPFSSGGISVKLTSLFSTSKKSGPFVRSLVHIDARSLTFSDEGAGWRSAVMDLAVIAEGDNRKTQGQLNKTLTIHAKGDEYRVMTERGLVYNFSLPVKKEGAYQVRVAVRDATSKKIGSGSQFLKHSQYQ